MIRVSNSLDPDQAQHSVLSFNPNQSNSEVGNLTSKFDVVYNTLLAQHSVGPGLGPNCLQKLSADDTRR